MKNKKKFYSLVFVSIALILFLYSTLSLTLATPIKSDPLKITETRITTSGAAAEPAIYDDKIVWQDNRNGNYDIYMYNLSTNMETQITDNESDQQCPSIYGDRIIWMDSRNETGEIYIYNLSTFKESQVATTHSVQWKPLIYGDKIVWLDESNGTDEIYVYNFSTSKETQITTTSSAKQTPSIYGDRIVWMDCRNENYDIYMYDLSISKEYQITTDKSDQDQPAIYGDIIVWLDSRDGYDWYLYMYNLSTFTETKVTSKPAGFPVIYGDRIAWENWSNGNEDIYMYNLSTSTETQITSNEAMQMEPALYGDKIVWVDFRGGEDYEKSDIYMCTVSGNEPIPPVAEFSATLTSGKVPLTVKFTDKSTGTPTKWKWNFGDGKTSTSQNPTHKYSKVGKYTVSLTIKNAAGSDTITKKDYIKAVTKPIAAFSATPTSGKAPLTVTFTDKSAGIPTSWKWSFGDGKTSVQQSPKHQYLQEGNYKVTLTVTNVAGKSTVTKTNFIKVTTNTRPGIYSESI